ncbi:MAG: hypothetical protein V3U24_02815 [Candidatus Neomarinimicrobiota bacterium]
MKKIISIVLVSGMTLSVGASVIGTSQAAPVTKSRTMDMTHMESILGGDGSSDSGVSLGCVAAILGMTILAFSLLGVTSIGALLWWHFGVGAGAFGILASCSG